MDILTRRTLDQILGVLKGVRKYHAAGQPLLKAYQRSVKEVAGLYHMSYQTIGDGCRRRLNLADRDEFLQLVDRWLRGDSSGLVNLLKGNVAEFEHFKVDKFFEEYSRPFQSLPLQTLKTPNPKPDLETEVVSFRIDKHKWEQMRVVAQISDKSIPEWLAEQVGSIVETEYLNHFKRLFGTMNSNKKRELLGFLKSEEVEPDVDDQPTEPDFLSVCTNLSSGKTFIYIKDTEENNALYVTPEAKIKNLSRSLFGSPNDREITEILSQGLITELQLERYREFLENESIASSVPNAMDSTPLPSERITEDDLIPYILSVLRDKGGKAAKSKVEEEIYQMLQPIFEQPWYQQCVSNGMVPRWKHHLGWAKERAKKRGLIKPPSESCRGYWEIADPDG